MADTTLTPKNQAPNMYVDWTDGGSYDFVIVDWYCETVANNTYWAVHNTSSSSERILWENLYPSVCR